MDGREVFRRAVRAEVDSISAVLERANLSPKDISLFVPHQANLRIIEAVNQRIGFDIDRTAIVLDKTGNTSAAFDSSRALRRGGCGPAAEWRLRLDVRLRPGMTWASTIVQWGAVA